MMPLAVLSAQGKDVQVQSCSADKIQCREQIGVFGCFPKDHDFFAYCRGYTHLFPRSRCCPTSPSLPMFRKTSPKGIKTECACFFFPILSDNAFYLSAKRRPSEPRTRKSSDVFDFLVQRLGQHLGLGNRCV